MFDKPAGSGNGHAAPQRRAAADVAKIEGGGLVHVIVTSLAPLTFFMFVNDKPISQMEVESFEVNIDVSSSETIVRASLSRYAKAVTGEQTTQYTSLFPSTIEVVALGRKS